MLWSESPKMEIRNSQLLLWNHCIWRGRFKNSNYCINKHKYKYNSCFIVTLLLSKLILPLFIKTREFLDDKCDTTAKWNWLLSSWAVNPWINNKNNKLIAQNTQMFLISPLCVCVCVTQSCPNLCYPMDCSPPGSSVHGILQARTLEWVAMSFSSKHLCSYSVPA